MPKSKRDRKVTLTKVKKKVGVDFKKELIDKVRASVDKYERLFVFSVDNMRNQKLKSLREQWRASSRFFMGKNRVMCVALGRTEADEYADRLHQVSRLLKKQCGLLFTNETRAKVESFFETHSEPDFARTGGLAQYDVALNAGPLDQFGHAMEPQLRALGMPTALKKGIIHLIKDFTVCHKGDKLSSEQARILKLLGHQQALFRIRLIAVWNKDQDFEVIDHDLPEAENAGQEEDEEEMSE